MNQYVLAKKEWNPENEFPDASVNMELNHDRKVFSMLQFFTHAGVGWQTEYSYAWVNLYIYLIFTTCWQKTKSLKFNENINFICSFKKKKLI